MLWKSLVHVCVCECECASVIACAGIKLVWSPGSWESLLKSELMPLNADLSVEGLLAAVS